MEYIYTCSIHIDDTFINISLIPTKLFKADNPQQGIS